MPIPCAHLYVELCPFVKPLHPTLAPPTCLLMGRLSFRRTIHIPSQLVLWFSSSQTGHRVGLCPVIWYPVWSRIVFAPILLALQNTWSAHLYCDCSAVVSVVQGLLDCLGEGKKAKLRIDPILSQIDAQISARPIGCITITKVAAHQDINSLLCPRERWLAKGNDVADQAAKRCVQHQHRPLFLAHQRAATKHAATRQVYNDFIAYLGKIALVAVKDSKPATKSKREFEVNNLPSLSDLVAAHPYIHLPIDLSREKILSSNFGAIFVWRVLAWRNSLAWPDPPRCAGEDISFLELYVDFILFSGSRMPVNLIPAPATSRDPGRWELRDLSIEADSCDDRSLATQSYNWTRFLSQTQKRLNFNMWPCGTGTASWSLHKIGHSTPRPGLLQRPALTSGLEAASVLRRYFIRPDGVTRSLRSPLDLVVAKPGAHPAWLDGNSP